MIFRRRQQKCWLSIIALLMLVCSCSDDERREIPTPAKPYLNVKDSLALVDIYKQAHGEGWTLVDWDLENIQTWGGVTAALDTVMNEYRVVGFVMQDGSSGILSDKIGDLVELRSLSLYGKGLYGELPKIYNNARLSINQLPWFKAGIHDRTPLALMNGCVSITDGSTYMRREIPMDSGVEYYSLDELEKVGEKIKSLVADVWSMKEKVARGVQYAEDMWSWKHWAEEFEEAAKEC